MNISGKLIIGVVILAIISVVAMIFFDLENIEGYEVGIVYKWFGGLQETLREPGLRLVWCGSISKVNLGKQKLTFADEKGVKTRGTEDKGAENEFAPIEVNCGKDGGQSAWIHISILYSLKKDKVFELYRKGIGKNYRYVVLKRAITEVVNQKTRVKEALDIYSGVGFNTLQDEIAFALINDPTLPYFKIHKVTSYQIRLKPDYESKIEDKQLAKQKRLRAAEEAKSAVEEAKKAAAEAQVEVEERTAVAEAKKITVVLAAEAQSKKRILDAEAAKEVAALLGEGQKLMKTAQAEGIEAVGLARAQVEASMKKAMYEGEAGTRRAQVTVANALALRLAGLLNGVQVVPKDSFVALMQEGAKIPLVLTDQGVQRGNQ